MVRSVLITSPIITHTIAMRFSEKGCEPRCLSFEEDAGSIVVNEYDSDA
jgi:hypothetical protein